MRTRNLNKMTNDEVEAYLERRDIIFVPVGVTETHGGLPLDCETILAEAIAKRMAEAADGLFLTGLPFFYAGSTTVGRGTVQMSISDGVAYLKEIAHSLIRQGFRRQIYLTFHGPAYLTVGTVIREVFEETGVPLLYIEPGKLLKRDPNVDFAESGTDLMAGAYELMGCLEDVPLNVPASKSVSYEPIKLGLDFAADMMRMGPSSGTMGHLITVAAEHMRTMALHSEEERLESARRGVAMIDQIVESSDIAQVVETLKRADEHMQKIIPNYPWLQMYKG